MYTVKSWVEASSVLARRRRQASRLAIVAGVVLTSSTASAEDPPPALDGVALSRFEPSERGSRFFVADSLELHHGPAGVSRPLFAVGIASSWASRARTFGTRTEGERSTLVEHALYLHPGASVVLSPGARFGLDVPVVAFQTGESTNLAGKYYLAPSSPRLGDVRASFDVRFAGPASRDSSGVAIAGGVTAWLPTGATADFAGDIGARFGVHITSAARFRWLLASARVGYMYRRDGYLGGSRVGSEANTVLGVAFADGAWTIGPELHGATVLDAAFAERVTPVEVIAGAHRAFGSFRIGAGVGTSVVSGMGASRLRALMTLEWAPPSAASDRDRDGVPDEDDTCPDVAGPHETLGCPAAPRDLDRDGPAPEPSGTTTPES